MPSRAISGPFLVKFNAAVSFIFLLILYSLCLKWKIEYLLLVWDSEVLEPAELAGFVSLYLISSDPAPYWSLRNSSALQELVPPSLVPLFIFYFFKQWGLFADKHLLEHSVLAFQIASTGERLTVSSEDCLVFYLRTQRWASSGMSVTGPCRDTVTQTLQLLSAASSSLSPTCRLDANPQTTDGSHWDYLCITL